MKKIMFPLCAALIALPSIAMADAGNDQQIFVVKKERFVQGVRHIEAVRQDGKKTAQVRIGRTGEVTGEVDGKAVKVTLQGL